MPQQTIDLKDKLAEMNMGDLSGDLNDENLDGRQAAFFSTTVMCLPR